MQMINVLKKLAELDANNPNVIKEGPHSQDYMALNDPKKKPFKPSQTQGKSALDDYADMDDAASFKDDPIQATTDRALKYGAKAIRATKNALGKNESMGAQGDIGGAHGEETISPIHGKNKKEEAMENLDINSLRQLAGVKQVTESGLEGIHTPASISITANDGPELSSMLKDIMSLAGVHQVGPEHMPVDDPTIGPSKLMNPPPMRDMINALDGIEDAELGEPGPDVMEPGDEFHDVSDSEMELPNVGDRDHGGREEDELHDTGEVDEELMNNRPYDSSPDEEIMQDPMQQFGDKNSGDHRMRQTGLPVAHPMEEITAEGLYADYQKFITESKKEPVRPTKKPAPVKKKPITPFGKKKEDEEVKESDDKPSKGMTKKAKSSLVKKAKAGKDIGKPGKNFKAVAKKAGGGKKGEKIAAAAMWKNASKKK